MALSPIPEERIGQVSAIGRKLATAPKIQDDLKAKFGCGENKFFYNELVEYRINNSLLDIAEDLASDYNQTVEERYKITTNDVARMSVGSAFRGHHNEEFMPDYQLNGLFSELTSDYIRKIKNKADGQRIGHIGGLESWKRAVGIHGRSKEQNSIDGAASVETHGDQMRNGGRASRGRGFWQTNTQYLEEICELRNEGLTWPETTDEFNRRHGTEYNSKSLSSSYHNNKDLLNDEEE